ncbi:MAG: hypothetical protein ACKO6B_07055 [Planctomycetia bacterium]
MAAGNQSVYQSFIIALIVFVMLTFVLAVTTYLFFKKADEAQKTVDAKQKEASEANTKRLEAEKKRDELVKDVLGLPEDMDNPEILAIKKDAIDDLYGKYLEQPTYTEALKWLSSSMTEHYESMKGLQAEKDRFAAEKQQLSAASAKEKKDLEASVAAANAKYTKLLDDQKKYATDSDAQKNELENQKKAANARATSLQDLSKAIEDVAAASYDDGTGKERISVLPEARKAEFLGKADRERVEMLRNELIARNKQIRRLNDTLAKLRVADTALQNTVRAATPKDDRVDGFDGRILSVNELDRTVLVSCGTTTGLRAGLMFDVYDPTDPRPQLGSNKAVVEVVAVESDSLVRCRVRKDSIQDPIIPGDTVATNLWSPGTPLEVVIVGMPTFGGTAESDRKRLEQLVQRVGGTVAETVSPSTTMVVDAGVPKSRGPDADGLASRRKMTDKEKRFREEQMKDARQMGIKVVAIEPFLQSLGLQVESVRSDRLPVPVESQAPRGRPEGIAF